MKQAILKPQFIYSLVLISTITWCLLIVLAPLFAHLKLMIPSGAVYFFFSKICHQHPDRSFFIWGKQFAVCVRCTGLYVGFFTGTVCYQLLKNHKNFNPPWRYLFLLALIPISVDLSLTIFGLWQNTFFTRFVTGFLLGNTVALFIIPGIQNIFFEMK